MYWCGKSRDASFLSCCANTLEVLDLGGKSDLDPATFPKAMPKLRRLFLSECGIEDASFLSCCANSLEDLDLSKNPQLDPATFPDAFLSRCDAIPGLKKTLEWLTANSTPESEDELY